MSVHPIIPAIGGILAFAAKSYFPTLSWPILGAATIGGTFLSYSASKVVEQCLKSCSVRRLEKELKTWCSEVNTRDWQYQYRAIAAIRIWECYREQGTSCHLDLRLTTLPDSIGALQNLKSLDASSNQLSELPDSVRNLQGLQRLDISGNRFQELPLWIGNFQSLQFLDISYNRQLSGLPLEIFDLPQNCIINLTGCPFSTAVLERIRERTSSPDYTGPRFSFSQFEPRDPAILNQSIDNLLTSIYSICDKEIPDLSTVKTVENLQPWLAKLSYAADFRNSQRIAFARRITELLELANEDEQFRSLFTAVLIEAPTTCGDRIALSIIHLSIAEKLAKADLANLDELSKLLYGSWIIGKLEKIAREKIPTLRYFDEIEVYLGYPMALKAEFNLPIDIQEMRFSSGLTDDDINVAREQILKDSTTDEPWEFLALDPPWQKALQKANSEEWMRISQSEEPTSEIIQWTKSLVPNLVAPQ